MELMLVASIILVAIGISTPIFRKTYNSLRIRLQVKDVASLMNLARNKAVFNREIYLIEIDSDKKTYKMSAFDEKKKGAVEIKGKWGKVFRVYKNVELESDEETVKFLPDGTSTGVSILFSNAAGAAYKLNADPKTGNIKVSEDEDEDEDEK